MSLLERALYVRLPPLCSGQSFCVLGSRLCDTLVLSEVNQFNRGQFAHVSHVDFIGTHKKVPAGTTHGRAAVNSRF